MKLIPVLLVMAVALSLCNLTKRFGGSSETNSNKDAGSTSSGGNNAAEKAERPQPTAAQTAALEGGQTINWDKQGISWTVPPKWTKMSDETTMFNWKSPGSFDAAFLIANISPMDESFPTETSLKAFYEGAKTRSKNGEVDELRWLEIDGVKGVQFRESNPEKPDDPRRLQWITYRKYAGQTQMVNLMLSSRGKDFERHQDTLYAILYSTKLVH